MAKKGSRDGSKTAMIKEALATNPSAKVKEIVAALAEKSVKVSAGQVYVVKRNMGIKGRKRRRAAATEAIKSAGTANPVGIILSVRKLANDVGGLKTLKLIVDTLIDA